MSADHVDVALGPLQRVVEEVRAGAGRLEKVADHRPRLVHDVCRRQPGLGSHQPWHGIACSNDGFDLADCLGEQPAQRTQPDTGLGEVGLRDRLVLLMTPSYASIRWDSRSA